MKVDMHEERLKKIKLVRVGFLRTQCSKCGSFFIHEKMWHVTRWTTNDKPYDWYYCQHCLNSKEEVLNEIDTDSCPFGIYGIDSHMIKSINLNVK